MNLMTNVLVNGITSLHEARYCAGMGVQMLGFVFDKACDNAINIETYQEITSWLTGVSYVGFFEKSLPKEINDLHIDYIHTNSKDLLKKLVSEQTKIIYQVNLSHPILEEDLLQYKDSVQHFVIETDRVFSDGVLDICHRLAKIFSILIDVPIGAKNVKNIVENIKPYGIAMTSSGKEISTGINNFDDIETIFESIEVKDY